ncbi:MULTISPECIES: helix-turn-helix transcriptional regulator [Providencia]|uniref:helix-turn-helix domain-containing protein n=1 Tax=Providencia TaxID=586 RepID=UPI002AB57028|nr:helix-turn-helix transcriptional regulator [Providencia stuartii]
MKAKSSLNKDIGNFLRESRKDKSLTAKQFGCLVKLSQQQISRYELGVTTINVEMLDVFLTALGKTWSDFTFDVMAYHSDEIRKLKNENFLVK